MSWSTTWKLLGGFEEILAKGPELYMHRRQKKGMKGEERLKWGLGGQRLIAQCGDTRSHHWGRAKPSSNKIWLWIRLPMFLMDHSDVLQMIRLHTILFTCCNQASLPKPIQHFLPSPSYGKSYFHLPLEQTLFPGYYQMLSAFHERDW